MRKVIVSLSVPDDMPDNTVSICLKDGEKWLNDTFKKFSFKFDFFDATAVLAQDEKMRHDAAEGDDYETQVNTILNILLKGGSITSMESFSKKKITRLSAAIHVIRHKLLIPVDGIFEKNEVSKKRYKRYFIAPENLELLHAKGINKPSDVGFVDEEPELGKLDAVSIESANLKPVSDIAISDTLPIRPEDFVRDTVNCLKSFTNSDYPQSIFYADENKRMLFEYKQIHGRFYLLCNYPDFIFFLESKYNLSYNDMLPIIKGVFKHRYDICNFLLITGNSVRFPLIDGCDNSKHE